MAIYQGLIIRDGMPDLLELTGLGRSLCGLDKPVRYGFAEPALRITFHACDEAPEEIIADLRKRGFTTQALERLSETEGEKAFAQFALDRQAHRAPARDDLD